jgi:hypothetical protein
MNRPKFWPHHGPPPLALGRVVPCAPTLRETVGAPQNRRGGKMFLKNLLLIFCFISCEDRTHGYKYAENNNLQEIRDIQNEENNENSNCTLEESILVLDPEKFMFYNIFVDSNPAEIPLYVMLSPIDSQNFSVTVCKKTGETFVYDEIGFEIYSENVNFEYINYLERSEEGQCTNPRTIMIKNMDDQEEINITVKIISPKSCNTEWDRLCESEPTFGCGYCWIFKDIQIKKICQIGAQP